MSVWNILVLILIYVFCFGYCSKVEDKTLCRCEKYKFDGKTFVVLWNSPTIGCDFNFSTPINLKKFDIYENNHQTWDGKRVTVFASAQLGLYPYYTEDELKVFNGGLPQLVDLNEHIRKSRMDILAKIPDPNYNGLAVIDWEPWRPLWETNWNKKRVYKVKSVENVRARYPSWPLEDLITEAKREFESAGRAMFEHTIALGKELRPKALWGFYGFPDCYGNKENHYQCNPQVMKQNDKMDWLYSSSTALFPSMYLLEEHPDNRDYVLGRLRETLRFVTSGYGKTRNNKPVFVYHRNIYEQDPFEFNFLSKGDLNNTIGLAADLGAAGVVIWGNRYDENTSPQVCQSINEYVHDTLGPYIQHKMRSVDSCSAMRCGHQGHCINKSLLPPQILKLYEQEQRLGLCHIPKKKQVQSNYKRDTVPRVFNTTYHNATVYNNGTYPANDYLLTNRIKGEIGDIGASHITRHRVNNTIMDDFFRQLNGTSTQINGTTPTYLNGTTPTHHNSNVTSKSNTTRFNDTQHRNLTSTLESQHLTNSTTGNRTATTFGIKRTNRLRNHTDFQHTNVSTNNNNVKKSAIPHPPTYKASAVKQYHAANPLSNQRKSDIEKLSHMSGSVIRIPMKRENITMRKNSEAKSTRMSSSNKRSNSSRKSEIYQSSGGHLPLMSSRKNHHSWLPHIYVILIGVSLGGALVFSLIFIGAYYYVSLKNTFPTYGGGGDSKIFQDDDNINSPPFPPKAHSSPKGSEILKDKRNGKPNDLRSHRNNDSKKDIIIDSIELCESKSDQNYKHKKPSYQRSKSCNSVVEENRKGHDKLDRKKRNRNDKTNTPPRRSKDEDGSEIEINVNDLR